MPIQQSTRSVPREDLGAAFHEYNPGTEGFVADIALPPIPVGLKAATMGVITRENLKRADSNHANGASFNRVNLISEDKSYACKDHGLEIPLTDEDRSTYETDYDAEYESVQSVTRKMYIEREIRVKDALWNTTTFTGSDLYTSWAAAPWDVVGSDAIGHIRTAITTILANTGVLADTMLIGRATMESLLLNTAIVARFPGVQVLTRAMLESNLAAILGLTNLIVGWAGYDGANEGQVYETGTIWNEDYALIYKRHTAGRATPGLGRVVEWTGIQNGRDQVVQYREEQTESDIFRVRDFSYEWIFDPYFGHLMLIDA